MENIWSQVWRSFPILENRSVFITDLLLTLMIKITRIDRIFTSCFFIGIFSAGLIFLTGFLTINFLNLVTCICLLAGALQKQKNFLVPYIILTTIYILIYIALGVWFFVKSSENSLRNGIISVVVIVVNIYCLIVVFQLYRLLKLREQNYPAFLRETNRQQQQQQAQNYETTYVKIP